jgi:ribosomal protein S5
MGSNNQISIVSATVDALKKMRTHGAVKQMRATEGDEL